MDLEASIKEILKEAAQTLAPQYEGSLVIIRELEDEPNKSVEDGSKSDKLVPVFYLQERTNIFGFVPWKRRSIASIRVCTYHVADDTNGLAAVIFDPKAKEVIYDVFRRSLTKIEWELCGVTFVDVELPFVSEGCFEIVDLKEQKTY